MIRACSCSLQGLGWGGSSAHLENRLCLSGAPVCVYRAGSLSRHTLWAGECCSLLSGWHSAGNGQLPVCYSNCVKLPRCHSISRRFGVLFLFCTKLSACWINLNTASLHSYFGSCALTQTKSSQTKLLTPVGGLVWFSCPQGIAVPGNFSFFTDYFSTFLSVTSSLPALVFSDL